MSLPAFFPTAEISNVLPAGEPITLGELCDDVGISCRVTGPAARRPLFLGVTDHLHAVRRAGDLGPVWLGIPLGEHRRRSLLALGMLAYGVHDYAARECLRGQPIARASVGPGRPHTGRALSPAQRQQRRRDKIAAVG